MSDVIMLLQSLSIRSVLFYLYIGHVRPVTLRTFVKTSSHSASGFDSQVIAPPAPIFIVGLFPFRLQPSSAEKDGCLEMTMVRMTTLRSVAPFNEMYPIAPDMTNR